MPTITNRNRNSKGYLRFRENLSKKLKCISLGEMTREEFQDTNLKGPYPTEQHLERSREFHKNKVTIHFFDRTLKQFSFIPIINQTAKYNSL